jgi:predicted nucleic acid-binding protein
MTDPTYVIDANIVLDWFEIEKTSSSSAVHSILDHLVAGTITVLAPQLLLTEVSNVLHKKKNMSGEFITEITQWLLHSPLQFINWKNEEIGEIIRLMKTCNLTAYDAIYLFLAIKTDSLLITSDEELLKVGKYCIHPHSFKRV